MLSHTILEEYKDREVPWSPIGYVTYKRTYARPKPDGSTEEWHETVFRCVNALIELGMRVTPEEARLMYDYVFNLKCCFSGRALWQLGTDTVKRLGADSLQNCWHVAVDEPEAFTFIFNELMLGGGVGANVQSEYVYSLPRVKSLSRPIESTDNWDCDFIVPDNREGWVELLDRILDSYFNTGEGFTFCTRAVRGKGEPIKAFGGTASGPQELVSDCVKICGVFDRRAGRKLRPIDCVDIINLIGAIVVSGNVRRSAEIVLGDPSDSQFLRAKRWELDNVPNHRAMSNNSIVTSTTKNLPDDFWITYEEEGEPYGLVNLRNCRRFGRMKDGRDYRPDEGVVGVNPCAEITLESHESCNLAEIFLPNVTKEEFATAAKLMYKATKTISCVPFTHPKTNEVVSRNHRLGISVTGLLASPYMGDEGVFEYVYREIEALDEEYSRELGVPASIKLTTVKPSGTLSLLPDGITPGVHPAFARYIIRRIRMSADHPMVRVCGEAGYPIEPQKNFDGSEDPNTVVVSFPMEYPNAMITDEVNALTQLEIVSFLQDCWADNSVSCTVYYKDDELDGIKSWLEENYEERIKSVSFLRHQEHGFIQAPLEEISKEKYEKMKTKVQTITRVTENTYDEDFDADCEGGACPVR